MVTVRFTPNLARHARTADIPACGRTVREVLDDAFAREPAARAYVLDETGTLRRHMTVFVSGAMICDRAGLTDPVPDGAEVWIMQALSGG